MDSLALAGLTRGAAAAAAAVTSGGVGVGVGISGSSRLGGSHLQNEFRRERKQNEFRKCRAKRIRIGEDSPPPQVLHRPVKEIFGTSLPKKSEKDASQHQDHCKATAH